MIDCDERPGHPLDRTVGGDRRSRGHPRPAWPGPAETADRRRAGLPGGGAGAAGYLCTRGAAEWEDADGVHYPGTYAHGGYNREPTTLSRLPVLNEDLVNLPDWLVLQLRIE